MTEKKLAAGDYILSRCSKCKDTLGHTIVAMVGSKVVRVECNTCGSIHNHREATRKTSAPRTPRQATSTPRVTKAERAWEELQESLQPEQAVPYSMTTEMKSGMTIQHPNFGMGLVVNCIRPNKMEVQFQSGLKMLRCKLA